MFFAGFARKKHPSPLIIEMIRWKDGQDFVVAALWDYSRHAII